LREGHDVLDSAIVSPAGTSNSLTFRTSDYTGTDFDPYLEVAYTQVGTTSTTTTYTYDHGMNRVSKTSDSGTTYYPSSDYSVTDEASTVYISSHTGLTASIENNGTTITASTIHTDHLGSTSVVTDDSGIMIELLDYNPFGTERSSWSSTSAGGEAEAQKTYIGEFSDNESGLSYLNARYYNPETGQFLSQDPFFLAASSDAWFINPQAQNAYSYARNNSIKYNDPTGEWPSLDQLNNFANKALSVERFVGNMMTFGTFGSALDNASASGQRMAEEGVSVKTVADVGLQVASGTVIASGSAFMTGAVIGEGYMMVVGALNEARIVSQLGNASGKTVNGTAQIPANWSVEASRSGGGFKYVNPSNANENIRLMPGNSNSTYPVSQSPYYRHQVNNGYLDATNTINLDNAATHFPINEIK